MIPQHFRGYQENERRVLKPSRRANQNPAELNSSTVLRIISYTFVLFRFCCTISGIARQHFGLIGALYGSTHFLEVCYRNGTCRRCVQAASSWLHPGTQLGQVRLGIGASGSRPALPRTVPSVRSMRHRSRKRCINDHFAVQGDRQQLRNGSHRLSLRRHRTAQSRWPEPGEDTEGPGQATVRAKDLSPSQLARGTEAARPPRFPIVVDDCVRLSSPL